MIKIEAFGKKNGITVDAITLDNENGIQVQLLSLGGAVRRILVPDRNKQAVDVCLGYDTLSEYLENDAYLGALVGRCANRIENARFTINGTQWLLTPNEGANQLHGGLEGFNQKIWDYTAEENRVVFTLDSPHLDEGYPGNLHVRVTYTLSAQGRLLLEYEAESDRDTVVNLTNHTYFNLSGHTSGPVYDQELTVYAARFTPCGKGNIPTGEIVPVEKTPLDFQVSTPIGKRIDDPSLRESRGYDHNYVIDGTGMRLAAKLYSPRTGIAMRAETTMEGMQVYTAGFLTDRAGKGGVRYAPHHGVCLETQRFPDAIHHPQFPSPLLRANTAYKEQTTYTFSTED